MGWICQKKEKKRERRSALSFAYRAWGLNRAKRISSKRARDRHMTAHVSPYQQSQKQNLKMEAPSRFSSYHHPFKLRTSPQASQSHYCFFFFVYSETLARPWAFLWEFEAMTTSFGAANTALLKDPKLQIPSFRGLMSSGSLALARHARSVSVSSPSPSAIRAVSTVRFCSDFLFISLL
jgi:hypothetical protein